MNKRIETGPVTKEVHCKRCDERVEAILVRGIMRSYATNFSWFCPHCQRYIDRKKSGVYLNATNIRANLDRHKIDEESIPIAYFSAGMRCAVCGERGTEEHHWAPQTLADCFEDQKQWPTDYLCKKHHDEWHKVIDVKAIKKLNNRTPF